MEKLTLLSDAALLARLRALVLAERAAVADVIEHLIELDSRRLYLEQAVPSLYAFCLERLGYSEDAALKRIRVARLAAQLPRVLDELRSGAIHLSGLVLLAPHLTEENADALLGEARGASRRKLQHILARWFPRPDVPANVRPLGPTLAGGVNGTLPGTDLSGPSTQSTAPGRTIRRRGRNSCRFPPSGTASNSRRAHSSTPSSNAPRSFSAIPCPMAICPSSSSVLSMP